MRVVLVVAVLAIAGFVFKKDVNRFVAGEAETKDVQKGESEHSAYFSGKITIKQKWELPSSLREVSGIAYIDDRRFACIQDEAGTVYIYNTSTGKIEKEIPFTGVGDFEDLVLIGTTAYIVRSDGKLFEVDINQGKSSVKEYSTPLTAKHNVEGLCFDKKNNRLLMAIKDEEPGKPGYKGIYAFDLEQKKFVKEPAYKIDLGHDVLSSSGNKKQKGIKPSAIGIHPVSGDIYITDGPKSGLLVMDETGNPKMLYKLGKEFEQPEGIAFSPGGEIFISNEGTKQPANIIRIEIGQ